MTSSNRVRVTCVREATKGVTPSSPRMLTMRMTGESLRYSPEYIDSEEIRSDRMMSDPILTMKSSGGGINFEFSYPQDATPLSEFIRSAMQNSWTNTPQRDNDGTADSAITEVATTGVITVETGAAFVAGHLVRLSGFTSSGNNGIFRITTGSATLPSVGASLLSAETAPPAAARMKVVGFSGTAGDIAAAADGLTSTSLDFTTLGLVAGQIIKIGGTAAGDRFATTANNSYARVTAVAANKITLDNLPVGWATDDGTGKTLKVWFGDQIKNGTTTTSHTIERGFLGQSTPTYIVNTGMHVNTMQVTIASKDKVKGTFDFLGMGGSQGTTSLDSSPDAETTFPVMSANADSQRFSEAGSTVSGPNWTRSIDFTLNNNNRTAESIGSVSPVDVGVGGCTVTGKANVYFGDNSILTKFFNGTPSSMLSVVQKVGRAVAFQFPRITYRGGNPSAPGGNQDVMTDLDWSTSMDTLTQAHILIDRLEYVE